jgi:hypothetical protein
MNKITGFALLGLFALVLGVPAAQHLDGSTASAGRNYKIKGEVREQSGGYRHVVIIKNKTRDWLSCEVWTDIDPQPPQSTRVGPRNTREVVIRTLAEEDEFIPYGFCRNN